MVLYLLLGESIDERHARQALDDPHELVADRGLVRASLGALHAVPEVLDPHFAAGVDQLRELLGDLVELVLRGIRTHARTRLLPKDARSGPASEAV